MLVNACVREESRTLRLAERVLAHLDGAVTELNLEREKLRPPIAIAVAIWYNMFVSISSRKG